MRELNPRRQPFQGWIGVLSVGHFAQSGHGAGMSKTRMTSVTRWPNNLTFILGSVSNADKIRRMESRQEALREADTALEKRMKELVEQHGEPNEISLAEVVAAPELAELDELSKTLCNAITRLSKD